MKEHKDFTEQTISHMKGTPEVSPERAYDIPCSLYSLEDYNRFHNGLMTVEEQLAFEKHGWDCLPCLKGIKEQEENEALMKKTNELLNSLDCIGD